MLQFGGGDRDESLSSFLDALLNPSDNDNTGTDADFGNQVASLTSQLLLPGPVPLTVYFEYAGEDTSTLSNLRLGNAALSAGLHFPQLGQHFDLTVELSEWQNAWYVHSIYQDGLRHEGNVVGHWGGDQRQLNDGVGARSMMARLGWLPRLGGMIEATYRSIDNEEYGGVAYQRGGSSRSATAGPGKSCCSAPKSTSAKTCSANRIRDQCFRSVLDETYSMSAATPFLRIAAVVLGGFARNAAGAEVFVDIGMNALSRRGGHRESSRHDNKQLERCACRDRYQACTRPAGATLGRGSKSTTSTRICCSPCGRSTTVFIRRSGSRWARSSAPRASTSRPRPTATTWAAAYISRS